MNHKFTHKGFFCGIVPVYIDMTNEDCPMICERHWSLLPLFMLVELLFGCAVLIRTMSDPDYEPLFPIKITGEYK